MSRCRGPRCGRQSRTSSRSRCAGPAVPGCRRQRPRLVGDVVEVEALVGLAVAEGRRRDAAAQRAERWRSPRRRRRRPAGARSPTWSTRPGSRSASLAEGRLERLGLRAVVQRRRGAVGVHVVDVVGADPGVVERQGDCAGGLAARPGRGPSGGGRRTWRRSRGSRPGSSAPRRLGRFGLLEHEGAGALAHHESVAARVERARDAGLRRWPPSRRTRRWRSG